MGVTTYGKGLIQQSYLLGDGSNIRLTIGRYTTPSGRGLLRTRTEEEDCMAPYRDQLDKNSFTSDLDLPESLITTTLSGRKIAYGEGGIVPDIHYIYTSDKDESFFDKMNAEGLLFQFASYYIHENRQDIFSRYSTGLEFEKDRMFEAFMLQELRKFLEKERPNYALVSNFSDKLIHQLKSWMASQLWHDNAFYEVENSKDRLMWRAREVLEGKIHDRLGISY